MDIYLPADFHSIRAAEKAYAAAHHDPMVRVSNWLGSEALVTRALYALVGLRTCKPNRAGIKDSPDPTWQVL